MLGIIRTPKHYIAFYWWVRAWFKILESLIGICSFGFLIGIFEINSPLSFKERLDWWICDWIEILESLFTILTFGLLWPNWSKYLFKRIMHRYYNQEA